MNRQYGALSGVAILLIVLNHAIHFGLQVSPVEGPWLQVLILLQALGAFAVPTFLFVSGAFLSYAAGGLSRTFIRSSVERILWPYVIWSLAFYACLFVATDARYPMWGYFRNLLVGYPYHFVPLLLFWYVTAPLVVRASRRHAVVLLAAVALYQGLLLALRFPGMFGPAAVLPAWAHRLEPPVLFIPMSDWALYFPLGLVLSLHHAALKPHMVRLRWLSAALTGGLFLLGILNAFGIVVAPWARLLAPMPLMFILPVVDRGMIPFLHRLEFLGRRSYGIYLAHFVVINILVSLAATTKGSMGRFPAVVLPTFMIAALGLSLVMMHALARPQAARKLYRFVFGIAPPPV
jgi:fucose 4-O-acetylase-like acetyltransferase